MMPSVLGLEFRGLGLGLWVRFLSLAYGFGVLGLGFRV